MALTLTVLDLLGDLTMGGATEVGTKSAGERRNRP
jgi:hypothetical protein